MGYTVSYVQISKRGRDGPEIIGDRRGRGERETTYKAGARDWRQCARRRHVEDGRRAPAVQVPQAVAVRSFHGVLEDGAAWVSGGRDQLHAVAEEGGAPALCGVEVLVEGQETEKSLMKNKNVREEGM